MTAYSIQRANIGKTWMLVLVFVGLIIGLSFVFSQALGDPTILYGGVIFAVGFNVLAYWFSDRWAMALNGAKEVSKADQPHLYRLVENLAITAGLPTPKVYLVQSAAPNAFATGRDPKHGAVAVTTGLLNTLNEQELEGVLAHELSHIKHYDTRLMVVAGILAGIVAILADMFLRMSWGSHRNNDNNRSNAIVFAIAIALSFLAPLFAQLLQLAISRKREFMADSGAALLTRNPEALATALERISNNHLPLKTAAPATAHLYIANPFRESKGQALSGVEGFVPWLGNLFATHPPMGERIRALRGMII